MDYLTELRKHREKTKDAPEHEQVFFFHAHTYFDQNAPEQRKDAQSFMELIKKTFTGNKEIEVHTLFEGPVGPHPTASFETLFTRNQLSTFIPWLQFNKPQGISVLVHPITQWQVPDHSLRPFWFGTPLKIDLEYLGRSDDKRREKKN